MSIDASQLMLLLTCSLLAIFIGAIVIRQMNKKRGKKRIQEGWSHDKSLILPLEEMGVPARITKAFLQLYNKDDLYPFVPHESLYGATYWEEADLEMALVELAKICHKKMPKSKKEQELIACHIDSVADFLKTLANLPDLK